MRYNFKRIAYLDIINRNKAISLVNNAPCIGSGCEFDSYLVQIGGIKLVVKKERALNGHSSEEKDRLLENYHRYQALLQDLGVEIAKTIPHFTKRTDGTYRQWILQEYFEPDQLLEHIIANASTKDVIKFFRELIRIFINLDRYNKLHGKRVGIDIKPPNLAVSNGSVTLFDNIPLNADDDTAPKTEYGIRFLPFLYFSRDFSDLYDNILMLHICFAVLRRGIDKELKDTIKYLLIEKAYQEYRQRALLKIPMYKFGKRLRVFHRWQLIKIFLSSIIQDLKDPLNVTDLDLDFQ